MKIEKGWISIAKDINKHNAVPHVLYQARLVAGYFPQSTLDNWGKKPNTKSFDRLVKEIILGESSIEYKDGKPVRTVRSSDVAVLYKHPEKGLLQLVELGKIVNEGYQPIGRTLTEVSEKLRKNQTFEQAAIAGIKSELGLETPKEDLQVRLKYLDNFPTEGEAFSYPELWSVIKRTKYAIELNAKEFKEQGYIERKGKRGSRFIWMPFEEVKRMVNYQLLASTLRAAIPNITNSQEELTVRIPRNGPYSPTIELKIFDDQMITLEIKMMKENIDYRDGRILIQGPNGNEMQISNRDGEGTKVNLRRSNLI